MRKSWLNIPRKLTHITVKFSTIWKQCVSITETMLCLYAVMKPAILDSRYTTSHNVKCIILAPTTMSKPTGKKK